MKAQYADQSNDLKEEEMNSEKSLRVKTNAIASSENAPPSAMFSLEESMSHYLVSIDIPTIPAAETEILCKRNELIVEGKGVESPTDQKQTYFRCRSNGRGIRASYQDGVLWLLLPKIVNAPTQQVLAL